MTEGTFHCVLTADDLVNAGLPASYVADDMPTGFTFGLDMTTERE